MDHVCVDTGAWAAIEDRGDAHQAAALRDKVELVQQRMPLCTTNVVLDESDTLLLLNLGYAPPVRFTTTLDQVTSWWHPDGGPHERRHRASGVGDLCTLSSGHGLVVSRLSEPSGKGARGAAAGLCV